jgi:hypothetical protein
MAAINGKAVPSNLAATNNAAAELSSTNAEAALTEANTVLNDFPDYVAQKETAFLDSQETSLGELNKTINDYDPEISTARSTLATKKTILDGKNLLPETTAEQQLAKIKALTTAQSEYSEALSSLNKLITDRNAAIASRDASTALDVVQTNRPLSTKLATYNTTPKVVTSVNADTNATITALKTSYAAAEETELTSLLGTHSTAKTLVDTEMGRVSSLNETLQLERGSVPSSSGAARDAALLRVRNTMARLANASEALSAASESASSALTAVTDAVTTIKANLASVGIEESSVPLLNDTIPTTSPTALQTALSRVTTAFSDNQALVAPLRMARAMGGVLTSPSTLNMASQLGRSISQFSGLTDVALTTRALFRPSSYSLAALPESLLTPTNSITRALSSSSTFMTGLRAVMPFLRVVGALSHVMGVVGLLMVPIDAVLGGIALMNADQTWEANHATATGALSTVMTHSSRDNITMPSPDDSVTDHGHESESGTPSTSYLGYWSYYLGDGKDTIVNALQTNNSAAYVYFNDMAHYSRGSTSDSPIENFNYSTGVHVPVGAPEDTVNRLEIYQANMNNYGPDEYFPDYSDSRNYGAYNAATMFYDWMKQMYNANLADGQSSQDAASNAVATASEYVTSAIQDGTELVVSRSPLPNSDTMLYSVMSSFTEQKTASVLALLKSQPTAYAGYSDFVLELMGLPPEAKNADFVTTQQFQDLVNDNPYYNQATADLIQNNQTVRSNSIVTSYQNLLRNIPEGPTRDLLLYQLQNLKNTLPGLSPDHQNVVSTLTADEAASLYNQVFANDEYISFRATWDSATTVYTPLSEFTSGAVPSWFSVGLNSAYLEYADAIPNEIENVNLQENVNLIQQLGTYDFTMSELGLNGTGIFNPDHTYQTYEFNNIQQVYSDMQSWEGSEDYASEFANYRFNGFDGLLLNNMFGTYRQQLQVENVAQTSQGAYQVLLNKIALAIQHPELHFHIMNEKDESGNSVSTVGVMQLNSNQLAHQQALYEANNDIYKGYPVAALVALGLNPSLADGALTDPNEDVGSNVPGGQSFSDNQVQQYAEVHAAVQAATMTTPIPAPSTDDS